MSKGKQIFKWWFGWDPEKIESWIEGMELQGWQLTRISWGGTMFQFQPGPSRKIRYCIDYQTKIDPHYKALFEEAGWELIYASTGWYVWRMPYSGVKPEIYSDLDSLIERNQRLLAMFSAVFAAQIPIFAVNFPYMKRMPPLLFIYIVIFALFIYALVRLTVTNRKLKEKKDSSR